MHATLRRHPLFVPEEGHRYSGRNNDGTGGWAETLYFIRTVGPVVLGLRGRGRVAAEGGAAAGGDGAAPAGAEEPAADVLSGRGRHTLRAAAR